MEWFVSTGWLYVIAIIVLVLHVWEEWVFPGRFHYIYNLGRPVVR